jgi:hypothetical protein
MRKAITVKGMLKHERALQAIADRNGGTRVAGTAGFDQSVTYVVNKLKGAGYTPVVQTFDFAFFSENSPSEFERISPDPRTYVDQESFDTMDYSGSGDVTAASWKWPITSSRPERRRTLRMQVARTLTSSAISPTRSP